MPASPRRPNVLFVFTDQQSRFAMGACGRRTVHTPWMDRLADGGTRFVRSYCTAPVCGPSRSSLVTGRMPNATGAYVNEQSIADGLPSFAAAFKAGGYAAAWAGKWHIPESYPQEPEIRGFENLPVEDHLLGSACDSLATQRAIDYIRRDHDRPWLLGVSLHNPHDICHRIWQIADEPIPPAALLPKLPANFEPSPDEPEFIAACRRRTHYGNEQNATTDWTDDHWRAYLYAYDRYTEQADECVGRIYRALHDTGQLDNTLICFTSDHGEGMAAHRWCVKLMFWEEAVSVPLIFHWPGHVPAGAVDQTHLAGGADIVPTLCDYAGVEPPPTPEARSLRPVMDDPSAPGRDHLVSELSPDPERLELKGRMVRTPRYKYMCFNEGDRPEMLFDMDADPGETASLAGSVDHADALQQHRRLLADYIERSADHFTMPTL